MASRTFARKWAKVALGLALFPAATSWESRVAAQTPAPFAAVRESETNTKEAEAREMLRTARQALKAGDLAKAEQSARRAQSIGVSAAFWEKDSPENVLADIANARARAIPNADPKTLLKLAREAMTAGKFDDAQALAGKAAQGNANWGMFGDNPNKCIEEIQKARARTEKADSVRMMTEARKLFDQGKLDDAESMAYRAERLHGPYGMMEIGDKPQKLLGEIQTARAKTKKPGTAVVQNAAAKPEAKGSEIQQVSATTAIPANKQRAIKMIVDGKAAMQSGRYTEARAKFIEAQKTCNDFRPDEDSPAHCLNELVGIIQKQVIDAAAGKMSVERAQIVRNVAVEFGLDVKSIDGRLTSKQTAVVGVGQTLLDKARLEMTRGQLEVARQLATEAHNGPYNCKEEAASVMRSIDAMEESAKATAAMKAFDAAVAAAQTKDFVQALAIFRQIEQTCLPDEQKTKIDQLMLTCKQQIDAIANVPAVEAPQVAPPVAPPPAMPDTVAKPLTPSVAAPAPAGSDRLADQVKALQRIEFQRLRDESNKVQSEAKKMFERGETAPSLEMLQRFLDKVKSSQLDPSETALLCKPVEQRLATLTLLKSQKDSETSINSKKTNHDLEKGRAAVADAKKREQIRDLCRQHNQFVKEGKLREAALCAAKAKELDPEDPALEGLNTVAQVRQAAGTYETAKKNNEKIFEDGLNHAMDGGKYVDSHNPLAIDTVVLETAKNRTKGIEGLERMRSEAEKEIQHKMSSLVDLNFSNAPLQQALDDLRVMTGINVFVDRVALEEERVPLDTPVTFRADKMKLESALKLMLSNVHLTSVIADDALKITTPRKARGNLVQRVYRVADLVMAIEDYKQPESMNLERAMQRHIEQQRMSGIGGANMPTNNGKFMLNNGTDVGSSNASMTTNPGQSGMSQIGAPTTTKNTLHEMIIKTIQGTISPNTWSENGGSGTIDYMPIGMALVINQTVDVQEQVAGLLDALRRLQDLQIAIEVKLITLSETFFERIGLDFNLNVKTDHNTGKFEPQIVTGNFKPAGQINDFSPNRFIAGLNPAGSQGSPGSFTSDLDIPIKTSSFQYGIPPFAYPNNPGFDGGLSLGLAFLSDIQVYMFMEAAQGDRRIHVMQAPKITLFNGQSSSISVQDQQFFVTNVGIIGFGGQVVFVPQNNPFPLGVEMTLQAVCSADRRYVRINTNVRLANLASANVPLFPITTFITPVFEGGAQGQPIPFTQFVQQPQLSLVNIQTTVSIPDGGTVILGGLKTLSEGRNEFGPPVLSKIPYVNRLFRNTGFGREAQSLLVMVTPRIIINAEEEERQTGISTREEQ